MLEGSYSIPVPDRAGQRRLWAMPHSYGSQADRRGGGMERTHIMQVRSKGLLEVPLRRFKAPLLD